MALTSSYRRRTAGFTALFAALLLVLTALFAITPANADPATCKNVDGFNENLEVSTSGDWGSITFSNTSDTLTLVVNSGYTVEVCVKAGSDESAGEAAVDKGAYPEGPHYISHPSGKDLSHYAYNVTEVTPEPEPTDTETTPEPEPTDTETTPEPEPTDTETDDVGVLPDEQTEAPEEPEATDEPEATETDTDQGEEPDATETDQTDVSPDEVEQPAPTPQTPTQPAAQAAAQDELPATGLGSTALLLLALLMLGLGTVALLGSNPRRQD